MRSEAICLGAYGFFWCVEDNHSTCFDLLKPFEPKCTSTLVSSDLGRITETLQWENRQQVYTVPPAYQQFHRALAPSSCSEPASLPLPTALRFYVTSSGISTAVSESWEVRFLLLSFHICRPGETEQPFPCRGLCLD